MHVAKTHLSKLIERAEAGQEIVIARRNKPVVRLVPAERPHPGRRFGSMKGKVSVGSECFEPLPEEELELWQSG